MRGDIFNARKFSFEMHLGKNGIYDTAAAEHKARVKRSSSKYQGMKIEANQKLKEYVIANLQGQRSPDEIAGRMKLKNQPFCASKKAIYEWLYSSYGDESGLWSHLLPLNNPCAFRSCGH